MPPKAKITKTMILKTVLELTQEKGFDSIHARNIAGRLQCSTRPIFSCYENMEELKKEFLNFAFEYYNQYVADYRKSINPKPYLLLPLSYIKFAKEEMHLFKLLFINDMELDLEETNDFYKEAGNEEKAKMFSDMTGMESGRAKEIFFDLFLFAHGIAVLTATGKMSLERNAVEKMLLDFLSPFIQQKNVD